MFHTPPRAVARPLRTTDARSPGAFAVGLDPNSTYPCIHVSTCGRTHRSLVTPPARTCTSSNTAATLSAYSLPWRTRSRRRRRQRPSRSFLQPRSSRRRTRARALALFSSPQCARRWHSFPQQPDTRARDQPRGQKWRRAQRRSSRGSARSGERLRAFWLPWRLRANGLHASRGAFRSAAIMFIAGRCKKIHKVLFP